MWGPFRKFIIQKLTAYPVIHGFTEVCRKGITFRSHPNYRHRGPWIDWCLINYGQAGDVPAKIVGFVLLVTMVGGIPSEDMAEWEGVILPLDAELVEVRTGSKGADGKRVETTLRGEVHAIIHTCDFPRNNSILDTPLMTRWDLEYDLESNEPILQLAPLRSIVSPIFVVEEFPGLHDSKPPSIGIYHVQDMHTWASTFTAPDQPP
jgi:hypothetical protein